MGVGADHFHRGVDVEPESTHDGEMVPEFLLIVFLFLDLGEEFEHGGDNGVGAACALVTVLDGEAMVDHLLYVAPVFREDEAWFAGVVCEHLDVQN